MPDPTTEMVGLLREIRDLLLPVADAHRDEYERRQAEREERRIEAIRAALSTPKRREAWTLADGTRTQREIAKAAQMDEGGTSKFFKSLRELGAIEGENPKRTLEA
ncbi:MAG: hypothetical protein ABR613_06745 [Actinomycetota bacterium]